MPLSFGFAKGQVIASRVATTPMILEIDTTQSAGTTFDLNFFTPTGGVTPNFTVDWGDGTTNTYTSIGVKSRTYASAGTYQIRISGDVSGIGWVSDTSTRTNNNKLTKIIDFGSIARLTSLSGLAYQSRLTSIPSTLPSTVTDLSYFFRGATTFNLNIGFWNTGNVTNMQFMFAGATAFNNGGSNTIQNWAAPLCTGFNSMFSGATSFNQPLTNLVNTSGLAAVGCDLRLMFSSATSFNQNIGSWNLSKVNGMNSMFLGATAFNNGGSPSINNWDTSKVVSPTFRDMFNGAISFNQPIHGWSWASGSGDSDRMFKNATAFNNGGQPLSWTSLGNTTSLAEFFQNATSFNQNIGTWDVSKITSFAAFLAGATAFNNGGSSSINNWTLNTTVGANINLASMFQTATSFNQPIGNWDTSSVGVYNNILNGATSFNQNIGSWKLGPNVRISGEATGQVTMPGMLNNVGMNAENYSRTLIGWANYIHNLNDDFTGKGSLASANSKQVNSVEYGGTPYSNGVAARAFLTSRHATLYQNWYGAAVSNTNSKMFACGASYIFKSDDGGDTWKPKFTDSMRQWNAIACSSDGTKVVAVPNAGNIWTSTDSGETWTQQTGSGSRNWARVAISSDGSFMAATVTSGFIYTSTDGGVTWTARMSDAARNWHGIAANSNGTNLVATVYNGQIYTSTDSGVNWTARDSARAWRNCCTSADGTKLAAVVEGGGAGNIPNGHIFTSSNSGATWTARATDQLRAWNGISCSSDGSVLAAIAPVAHPGTGGFIHTSSDSGVTWTQRTPGVPGGQRTWAGAISVSGDGTKMLAGSYSTSGEIAFANARLHRSTNSGVAWSRLAYTNSKSGTWNLADGGIADSTALYVDMATGTSYLPSDPSTLFNLTTLNSTGTIFNSPTYDVSDGVNSLSFNGTNQYVLGNSNLGISGNAAFTIGGWVEMNSLPNDWASFIGNNSTGSTLQGLSITMRDGRPALDFWNTRWRASSALNTGTWYHIMVTKAAGAVSTASKIYINGVEVAGALEGTDGTPNISNSAWVLGRLDSTSTRHFNGNISSAVAYTRVLTAAEVLALYDAQKSKFTPM
jgi:hypothetical protein